MKTSTMTTKERFRAALLGQPVDRLAFWPKLFGAYEKARTGVFAGMTVPELHQWIGSDRHDFVPHCTREVRTITSQENIITPHEHRIIFRTPAGEAQLIELWDEASLSWHPVAHPITDYASLLLMIDFFSDMSFEFDADLQQHACKTQESYGDESFTGLSIGESPLMYFIEYLAGVEMAHFMLTDYPAEVAALFDAIHQGLLKRTEIETAHSPADTLYFTENTSTTLISPEQYRKYCLPYLHEYASITRAAGRPMTLHMCGHLKAILPDLATLPVEAFEAFTSPTLGNTTLLDGRLACPNICLIGGTNAMLWLRPANEIIAQLEHDLNQLPHHRRLVITSAGVMPPMTEPETIKSVCDWVKSYPIIN